MTSAVISVPAVNTVPLSSWKVASGVPGSGVLHPSVKSVSSTGVRITKVFPAASQSLLVSVTVTLASEVQRETAIGAVAGESGGRGDGKGLGGRAGVSRHRRSR